MLKMSICETTHKEIQDYKKQTSVIGQHYFVRTCCNLAINYDSSLKAQDNINYKWFLRISKTSKSDAGSRWLSLFAAMTLSFT